MSEPHQHSFNSPIGRIHLTEEGGAITGLTWVSRETSAFHSDNATTDLLAEAERQIHAYFAKERRDFELPLAFNRGSAFPRRRRCLRIKPDPADHPLSPRGWQQRKADRLFRRWRYRHEAAPSRP